MNKYLFFLLIFCIYSLVRSFWIKTVLSAWLRLVGVYMLNSKTFKVETAMEYIDMWPMKYFYIHFFSNHINISSLGCCILLWFLLFFIIQSIWWMKLFMQSYYTIKLYHLWMICPIFWNTCKDFMYAAHQYLLLV